MTSLNFNDINFASKNKYTKMFLKFVFVFILS